MNSNSQFFKPIRQTLLLPLSVCLCVLVYSFTRHHFLEMTSHESIKFFHMALSQAVAQFGFIKALPQTPLLNWSNHFFDPNPLYTRIAAIFYSFFGTSGYPLLSSVIAVSIVSSLMLLFARTTSLILSLALVLSFLIAPEMSYLLSATGPRALELLCFIGMVQSLIIGRFDLMLFSAVAYSLSAAQIFLALAIMIGFLIRNKKKQSPLTLLLLPAYLLAIVLLHPYLPQSFRELIHQALISFNPTHLEGAELPLRTDEFFKLYLPYALLVLCSGLFLSHNNNPDENSSPSQSNAKILLALSVFFWGWTAFYRPMFPYAFFLSIYLVAATGHAMKQKSNRKLFFASILCLSLFGFYKPLKFYLGQIRSQQNAPAYAQALSLIPREAIGKTVLNCSSDEGNFVFYYRPDLKVVDLYSNRLLMESNKQIQEERQRFKSTGDSVLKADFVLCRSREVYEHLKSDSNYQKLFPTGTDWVPSSMPYLFARSSDKRVTEK